MIVFVGGKEHHVEDFKNKNIRYKNILLVGSRPHEEMPFWIKSADVVVLPNTAKEDISKYYTSPLKMFEYMAGKTPIVASDLPSIREILNEGNAVLVEPDNSKKLAEGISRILNNNELGVKISEQSFFDVQNYTWRERSEQVIDFIK